MTELPPAKAPFERKAGDRWVRMLDGSELVSADLIYLGGVTAPTNVQLVGFVKALERDTDSSVEIEVWSELEDFVVSDRADGRVDTNFAFRLVHPDQAPAQDIMFKIHEAALAVGAPDPVRVSVAACNQPPGMAEAAQEAFESTRQHVEDTLSTIQLVSIVGLAGVGLALYKGWL